jgi:hypothetical protein
MAGCNQRLKNSGKTRLKDKERIATGEKRAYVPTLPGLKSKWI